MEKVNNILDVILLVGIIQGFVFNIFLFINNKSNNKTLLFLNLMILFFSLNNLQSLLVKKKLVFNSLTQFCLIDVSWNIFIAPMFFLFLIFYLRMGKYFRRVLPITILVFVFSIILRCILFFLNKPINLNEQKIYFRKYSAYEDVFVLFFTVAIFALSIFVYNRAKNRFIDAHIFNTIEWIRTFFIFTTILLFLWFIAIFLDVRYTNIQKVYFYTPLHLGTSFIIYWLGYQGYNQYILMQNRISLKAKISENEPIVIVDEDTISLNEKELQEFKNVKHEILKNKLFLEANLSLSTLADKLSKNTNHLSKLINTYSAYNFTDFINNYRIAYAKKILINKKYNAYTIIAIGLECGFNSKSTFYIAFKKFTNQTPLQYRKNHIH